MLEARGALVCAKSNTPEFEAGAHTFNEVFGITRNPWDLARTAGGSSGGAAVAVASGMAWIAQGSDFAASLRNPAGFNGVVGLRPSPGVVPQGPNALPFQSLSVHGPIARDVADCGFALDAMAGAHPADPWARPHAPGAYAAAALRPEAPRRLAASADLGITPVDPSVRAAFGMAVDALARAGAAVEEARPELSEAHAAFGTLRAVQFASAWSHLLAEHRAAIKPDAVWNMEAGLSATGAQIASAERARTALRARLTEFLGTHTALVLPTAIVPPFPATLRYVSECDGIELPDYVRWMANCYAITLAGCPAISVPAGATADGLPLGLQIVAAPHAEARLLSVAAWAEAVLAPRRTTPIDPREPAA
jgi:amidase